MGPPKRSPFAPPPPQPALQQTTTCDLGRRCHVSGKNLRVFGSAFTRDKVREIASSSVLLIDSPKGQPSAPIASGTLIASTVVLCAAHSVQFIGQNTEVLLFHEASDTTAPPGRHDQYRTSDPASLAAWRAGTSLRTKPQGVVVKVLEQGDPLDLDYALLSVKWTDLAPDPNVDIVDVPRFPVAKAPSRSFSKEVLLIGHPVVLGPGRTPPQIMADVETAQGAVGIVSQQFGPNSETNQGDKYGYASLGAAFGMSGGGVFNDSGNIIGVLKGVRSGLGTCFLNLGQAATARPTSRIGAYVDQPPLLRAGDPNQNISFRTKP